MTQTVQEIYDCLNRISEKYKQQHLTEQLWAQLRLEVLNTILDLEMTGKIIRYRERIYKPMEDYLLYVEGVNFQLVIYVMNIYNYAKIFVNLL